jgi:hypothetical protein
LWHAALDPGTLQVRAWPDRGRRADRFDPARFNSTLIVTRDPDGKEHVVLSDGRHHVRLDILQGSIERGEPVFLEYRLEGIASARPSLLSLRRFLDLCRTGRFSGPLFRADRRLPRMIQLLQVHDALRAGATQRDIAIELFGAKRVETEWAGRSDSLRSRVRRLVRDARAMAGGGYRVLLAKAHH